ncbi:MAG: hypothetical protein AB8G99_17465, partial [Planctomycetaceae bacterium]
MRLSVFCVAFFAAFAFCFDTANGQITITTNDGGADVEVRESQLGDPADPNFPTGQNRGDNSEIATRLSDTGLDVGNDRNSSIYLKFDISGLTATDLATNNSASLRLHLRNNNLGTGRISHQPDPAIPAIDMSFDVYGLVNHDLADWEENNITYYNAPGITPDGEIGTKDFNDDLSKLGSFTLPPIGTQNWLPVGTAVDFSSTSLLDLVSSAVADSQESLTLVVNHGLDGTNPGTTPANFLNFNYLFIPKDVLQLNGDPNWDPDTTDEIDPIGSPFSEADNSLGAFSP